jgi:hypothetical protein
VKSAIAVAVLLALAVVALAGRRTDKLRSVE